jgi:hypothetical protein
MTRFFGTRRLFMLPRRRPAVELGPTLLRVGPFASDTPVEVSTLSDITYSVSQAVVSSRASPLKYKNLTINNGVTLTPSGNWCVFIHCDLLTLNGTIDVSGQDAVEASDGGNGGSGGGAGPGSDEDALPGGVGGSGGNGGTASDGIYGSAGTPGTGTGSAYSLGFTYPLGGDGAESIDYISPSAGGLGGFGYGGGGGATGTGGGVATYGGAGGGGLICIVAKTIVFGANGRLIARGGAATFESPDPPNGGAGGGGAILTYAQKKQTSPNEASVLGGLIYDAAPPEVRASPGDTSLYKILSNGTANPTEEADWTSTTWDNTV